MLKADGLIQGLCTFLMRAYLLGEGAGFNFVLKWKNCWEREKGLVNVI